MFSVKMKKLNILWFGEQIVIHDIVSDKMIEKKN